MKGLRELKVPHAVIIIFVLFAFSIICYSFWYQGEAYCGPKSSGNQYKPDDARFKKLLRRASMPDKNTVIVTILEKEWANPGSIFDIFLEGIKFGHDIENFLENIIVFTVDNQTHRYCKSLHRHCFNLDTYRTKSFWATFKNKNNRKLGWRIVDILGQMVDFGYNVIFTEMDVLWLRNPFSHFNYRADIITARENSHSRLSDLGFFYLNSNARSMVFFKYWKMSSILYPNLNYKSVFEIIKDNSFTEMLELKIEYLDTDMFSSSCEPSEKMACAIHAKCSGSSKKKAQSLRQILDFAKNSSVLVKKNGLMKTSSP